MTIREDKENRASARPQLDDAAAPQGWKAVSILSSVEGAKAESSAPRKASTGRWLVATSLLVVLAGIAAARLAGPATDAGSPARAEAEAAKPATADGQPASPPTTDIAASVASAASGGAAMTARIETPEMPASTSISSASPEAPIASPVKPDITSSADAASGRKATLQKAPASRAAVPHHASAASAVASAKARASHRDPARAEARREAREAGARDPDVALLAALMAHESGTDAAPTKTPRAVFTSPNEGSIAALVRRCNGLAGAESRQCQRRICEGYWGKAQACPGRPTGQAD